jgi:hypothetical protein
MTELFLLTEQGTKRLDLALESGVANLQVVSLGSDFLKFGCEGVHLIDAFLAVAASSEGVGFPLLDARGSLRG